MPTVTLAGEDEIAGLKGLGHLTQQRLEAGREHHLAVHPALALPDRDHPAVEVEIPPAKSHGLADSRAVAYMSPKSSFSRSEGAACKSRMISSWLSTTGRRLGRRGDCRPRVTA